MPFFSATIESRVREVVVVEANSIDEARQLIDDDADAVVVIAEHTGDFEIIPGSLSEAMRQEVVQYHRRLS